MALRDHRNQGEKMVLRAQKVTKAILSPPVVPVILTSSKSIQISIKYSILRLKINSYPVHDVTKVINHEDTRAIFLSKKEGEKMEASIDMDNNTIAHVKAPDMIDQYVNQGYL